MELRLPFLVIIFIVFSSFNGENGEGKSQFLEGDNYTQLLEGNWVLVKIEAPDSIDIVPRSLAKEGFKISSDQTTTIPYERVVLKDYLSKQLIPGITKFIFNKDNTFIFFRKEAITFSGNWVIQKNELILEYKSAEALNTKLNRLVRLDSRELVLESESHNKIVLFYFIKR